MEVEWELRQGPAEAVEIKSYFEVSLAKKNPIPGYYLLIMALNSNMSHSRAGLRHEQLPLHRVLPVFYKYSDFIALQKGNSHLIHNTREIFYLFQPSMGPTVKMPVQLSAMR